ncbi:MAG: flagellar hook-length control protein FliK [Alphaproteobacteria bacterium]
MSDVDTLKARAFDNASALSLSATKKGSKTAEHGDKSVNFAEIMRNNSPRVSGGLGEISSNAGITGVSERSDNAPDMDTAPRDYDDNARDTHNPYDDADSRAEQGNPPPTQAVAQDDYGREQIDARPADASDNSQDAASENRGETAPGRDNQDADNAQDNDDAPTNEGHVADASEDDSNDGDVAAGETNDTAEATTPTTKTTQGTATTNAEQILNSLLASAQSTGLPGQAAEKAGEQAQVASGRENAETGLAKAQAAVSQKGNAANNSGSRQANTGNQNGQAQANATAQTNANANANANAQLQQRGDAQATDTIGRQAAQLAKAIGDGNKVNITVNVVDEAKTLVSKPTTALAAGAAVAAETGKPSLRAQQAQGNQNASAGQAQLTGQAAAQVQAPQPVAGTQAQIINAAGMDAKGAGQAMAQTGGLQNAAAGGETPATIAANNTQTAQQSQQSASAKAATAPRFSLPGQAVTDQVTVQITKAVNAGADKISIQLRPADLGRVDIKMEVGADGRVLAVVTADNKATLDLLKQDSKGLEQALQDAGLQTDSDSLSFQMREQQGEGEEADAGASGRGADADDGQAEDETNGLIAGGERHIITDSRIDVRA